MAAVREPVGIPVAAMACFREEMFGPVQTVQKFSDLDDPAFRRALDDTVYGMSGSVWTRSIETAFRTVRLIDSGQVGVNTHAAGSPETPFGGNRQSGRDREFGREGVEAYLKTKAISVNVGEASDHHVYVQRLRSDKPADAYR